MAALVVGTSTLFSWGMLRLPALSPSQIVRRLLLLISVGLIVFANERSRRDRRG